MTRISIPAMAPSIGDCPAAGVSLLRLATLPYPDKNNRALGRLDPLIVGSSSHVIGNNTHILGMTVHPDIRRGA